MPGDITITVPPDKLENAQIRVETATEQTGAAAPVASGLRTVGAVQANEYSDTGVFPVAGGIVRQVNAELGDRVKRGSTLAVIFSTELADAQSVYLKMLAEAEEHHQHYRRTEDLLEIGAVSREEFEMVTSNHKTAQANVASARQRLILLGMTRQQVNALNSPDEVSSLIPVPAPVSGTVIDRAVNGGEVVEKGKELFRVADLSTVWVIGQIYEADFRAVRAGAPAFITTSAYPGQTFRGRVSYIDPRVDPSTRTAQVRVEVRNPGEALKLGLFVDINFGGAAPSAPADRPAVMAPRVAVQTIGSKQVVYLASDRPGVFIQREVITGPEAGDLITVYGGVRAGDRILTEGSFLLRAESLKINPAQLTTSSAPDQRPAQPEQAPRERETERSVQTANVVLTKDGYKPDSINLRRGVPARLTFVREAEVTCGTEVVIPEYGIKLELPLNEPVIVAFTPNKAGEFTFSCGMNMLRGKLIVR
jgi:RND family efflux transporter MFP subunit